MFVEKKHTGAAWRLGLTGVASLASAEPRAT
jgi:hypothetical protein